MQALSIFPVLMPLPLESSQKTNAGSLPAGVAY